MVSPYLTSNNTDFGAAANQAGQWNNILEPIAGLTDTSNATTSVSLNLAADALHGSWPELSTDLQLLVNDNFFSFDGSNWTVTLSGLDNGAYNVFYYGPNHPSVVTGAFTINGTGVASITGDNNTSFVQGTNYDVLNGVSVSNGTLTLTSTDTSGYRGLSGLQLVQTSSASAVPWETDTLSLIGSTALSGFGLWAKGKLVKRKKDQEDA